VRVRRLAPGAVERFPHVPAEDVARARIVVVAWLTRGVAGMTLGRWILLRRDHADDADLVGHELVHVRQWREQGAARFLVRYLGEYLRLRRAGLAHWPAYRAISFEAEARELSGR
jgi:hypothetical protein